MGELSAARCSACHTAFATTVISRCSNCWSTDLEDVKLPGAGVLYSYTKVMRAPVGFEPGYTVGLVDLDAGPRVFGVIDEGTGLRIGMALTGLERISDDGPIREFSAVLERQ